MTPTRYVERWVEGEVAQETLVREAAARATAGCTVDVTGLNVELVRALPVLMPLADEAPRDCAKGARYLVVIDAGGPGNETPPDDPVLSSCAPEPGAGLELERRQDPAVYDVSGRPSPARSTASVGDGTCNLCGRAFSTASAELLSKDGHSIVRCPTCGLIFRSTLPTRRR